MGSIHGVMDDGTRLAGVVRDVRNRWRLKRALAGATLTLVVGFVVLALAAYVMNAAKYAPVPTLLVRIAALAIVLAAAIRWLVLPLRRNPRDQQVALYLEEHEPALDGALMTAVDVSGNRGGRVGSLSPSLAARLLQSAVERVRTVDDGRHVGAGDLVRSAVIFAAVLVAVATTLMVGPAALRYGVGVSLEPWRTVGPAGVFSIDVKPGNVTVAKGGDQLFSASLHGFNAERVELLVRPADSTAWTRLLMAPDSAGTYAFGMFDVASAMDYTVEAAGVRSATYHVNVANLPYVKQVDLQYHYPAYTQLPPRNVDGTGDIAALAGTMVRVRITPTVPTSAGRLVLDNGDTLQLAPAADGSLTAMLRVRRPGFYKVELAGPNDRLLTASLNYNIDVLDDRPPTVSFTKPGRDQKVLSVDEVYTEAKAEDDFGIARLDLVYAVNGGPERSVPLSQATSHGLRNLSAGYTFMLEDDSLQPGDVVAYYARATDNNTVTGPGKASSDIYFLNVRPYEQEYRQGQGGGGGGGGGGQQQDNAGQLSQQERQIIAGTFNLTRDSATYSAGDLQENLSTLRLAQQKLREQVTQLTSRLVQRGITASDTGFKKIAELLGRATPQMDTAEQHLAGGRPHSALSSEQRALVELQRADAVFHDIQVSEGGGGGGSGASAGGANADDLADIFEMNRDKMRNQYETVQRGQDQQQKQQEQANQQVDQLMEKLKALAARQQQQDQRAQAKADSMSRGQAGSSSGSGQRQLAQQTEDAARQLERLARDKQSQDLAEAARRLQDAANSMRRAAADRGQQGAASSQQAQEQLEQARRLLDRERAGRAQRGVEDAMQTQRDLANRQQRVEQDIKHLPGAESSQQEQVRESIARQQAAMRDSVRSLTSQLERLSLDTRRDQPEAARTLAEAADSLKRHGTDQRLASMAERTTATAPAQYLNQQQEAVGKDVDRLGKQLQRAQAQAGRQTSAQQQAEALDRMRDLVQGLQSTRERMQQLQARAGDSAQGQQQGNQGQGAQGQQGQGAQGQQGQGAQGQQGAQGGTGGQRGQQAQGGMRGGGGARAGGGNVPMGGGAVRGLSPAETRQFSRELTERLADADTLRQMLQRQGEDVAELDRAIANLRNLTRPTRLDDPNATAMLRAQVIEGLKAYEFALRRSLKMDGDQVLLGRPGEVPPAFRAQVEEYYRAIAKSRKGGGG